MISLGLGELVSSSSFILRTFFGGEEGIITNRTKAAAFFGLKFGPQIEMYYLDRRLVSPRDDRDPRARRDSARPHLERRCAKILSASSSSAIGPRRCASGPSCSPPTFAGLAGGLSALDFEIMNSQQLGAQQSGLVLLMTYVGGVGHFFGPVLGAAIITYLQERLSDVTDVWQLYFGLMFIGVVMLAPGGLAGWIAMHVEAGGAANSAVSPHLTPRSAPAIADRLRRRHVDDRARASPVRHVRPANPPSGKSARWTLDAATSAPWLVAFALVVAGGAGACLGLAEGA